MRHPGRQLSLIRLLYLWWVLVLAPALPAATWMFTNPHPTLTTTHRPPIIVSQTGDQAVSPGADVTFNVEVAGTPPFGYQWLRNDQVIVPFSQGAPSLTLSNVQAADAGRYAVLVTNSANPSPGVRSSEIRLDVTGRLLVVDGPVSHTAMEGETVRFEATAAGDPPIFYQWRCNGSWLRDQTNSFLSLSDVQVTDGGSFSVVVHNSREAVTTGAARLIVRGPPGPSPSDDFRDRPVLSGFEGVLQGDSELADTQTGEVVAPGGGRTVWFEWVAPAQGIVTLTSLGSAFDTQLMVHEGTALADLVRVASDDDRGKFYTSKVQFNARHLTSYFIALDGFALKSIGGPFTLSWKLEPTAELIPMIRTNPATVSVRRGSDAIFEVAADPGIVNFQWLSNGVAIPGATSSRYVIPNAQPFHVGRYFARLTSPSGRSVETSVAELQLNSAAPALGHDKYANLYQSSANGNRPAAGFISIGIGGTVLTNDFYSGGDGEPDDPNPCGSPFFGTVWVGLTATNNGVIQVDTIGSQIFSRLAVYALNGSEDDFAAPAMICDLTSAGKQLPCVVKFDAAQGTNYTVVVEGYQAAGQISVTCQMGIAPDLPLTTACLFVAQGGSVSLQMPATNWWPVPACQWLRNGQPVPDGTNTSLHLANFSASAAGSYSVVMSNFVRVATNVVAHVSQIGPLILAYSVTDGGGNPAFVVSGSAAEPFVLESAAELSGAWGPLATNTDPCHRLVYTNLHLHLQPQRFFRAVHWPTP